MSCDLGVKRSEGMNQTYDWNSLKTGQWANQWSLKMHVHHVSALWANRWSNIKTHESEPRNTFQHQKRDVLIANWLIFVFSADLVASFQTESGLRSDHPSSAVSVWTVASPFNAALRDEVSWPLCLLETQTLMIVKPFKQGQNNRWTVNMERESCFCFPVFYFMFVLFQFGHKNQTQTL